MLTSHMNSFKGCELALSIPKLTEVVTSRHVGREGGNYWPAPKTKPVALYTTLHNNNNKKENTIGSFVCKNKLNRRITEAILLLLCVTLT